VRIRDATVRNFRCITESKIEFDDVTTLIGPSGVGKSAFLRALDWFFNGSTPLSHEDLRAGAAEPRIEVEVTFHDLTPQDRLALGKYASPGIDEFRAWKIWLDGEEVITGKAKAFEPFQLVRSTPGAKAKRAVYERVLVENPGIDLPSWGRSEAATLDALDDWERDHPELLSDLQISAGHFFGFNSRGKLSGLFDYVFVSADLRASEEAQDSRASVIGRILEKAIDRSAADSALDKLVAELTASHDRIVLEHFGEQLEALGDELTQMVGEYSKGRAIDVSATPAGYHQQPTKFAVSVSDGDAITDVTRQGHGFQRSLLIAALRVLAQRGSPGDGGQLCLSIEEPELYQHPVQARGFASVLRALAEDSTAQIQVTYATHSPDFVESRHFDQVRRISRARDGGALAVRSVSQDRVVERLSTWHKADVIIRQLDGVVLNQLSAALFVDTAVLVEGTCDAGVLVGAAERTKSPGVQSVAFVDCHGKTGIPFAHAVLSELGLHTVVVFDGDSAIRERLRSTGKTEDELGAAELNEASNNERLLAYLGTAAEPWPQGCVSPDVYAFADCLETWVDEEWPDWRATLNELVRAGKAFSGKDAESYRLASRTANADPPQLIRSILTDAGLD